MTTEPRFKAGEWVRFSDGRTTTITNIVDTGKTYVYYGYFCGGLISGTEKQTKPY